MERFAAIGRELRRLSGVRCAAQPERRIAGGSIHEAYAWRTQSGRFFVKVAPPTGIGALESEADGLAVLSTARALRVPGVIGYGTTENAAFLALEWIERGKSDARCEERLGTQLAALHALSAQRYGYERDNFIGATPQANAWSANWAEFFRERRLRPQLALAAQRDFGVLLAALAAPLLAAVPALLRNHAPRASLLHGDLWGGNWFASSDGAAVIFDPAVYYGDREADLAMTRLFGGFGPEFYRAYCATAPLPPQWELRAELYNLYHVLNHANLFGGAYAGQARAMIERLLR
jgi:fructosamine-3-kinase